MAQTFHITPAATFAALDANNAGKVSFTITNASAKPVRAWPEIKPLGATMRDWLEIEGQAERAFGANEVQVYTVAIKSPAGTPAGKYEFKLNVINADKADLDGCTEGPPVQFVVSMAAPPPAPKKWLWAVAAALILLIGAAVALLLSSGKTEKPPAVVELPVVVDPDLPSTQGYYALLVRGGPTLSVTTKASGRPTHPTTLVLAFTRSPFPAPAKLPDDAKLAPGHGAWMDRAVNSAEPTQIECNVTEEEAKKLLTLLHRPDVYYTFVCTNTNKGFMKAARANGQIVTTP